MCVCVCVCEEVFAESDVACAAAAKASAAAVAAVASSRRILRRRETARSCATSIALAVTAAAIGEGTRGGGAACRKMALATWSSRGRCGLSAVEGDAPPLLLRARLALLLPELQQLATYA